MRGAKAQEKFYEEICDLNSLKLVMKRYLIKYNEKYSRKMHMTFFPQALEHICRI